MTHILIKYAIGISSVVGIFLMPLIADASSGITPTTGSNGDVTVTVSSPQTAACWYHPDGSLISCMSQYESPKLVHLGSLSAGTIIDFTIFDNNNLSNPYYCGFMTHPSFPANFTNCTVGNNFSGASGIIASYLFPLGPTLNGFQQMIGNASSTFTQSLGFGWQGVVGFMGGMLLNVIGSGMGVLMLILKYIIALLTIWWIVYFAYKAFRFFKH